MKLFKCRVSGDEVASDAYPGEYPDPCDAESKAADGMEGFFYAIKQDERRMNGDNEMCSIAEYNEMEGPAKEDWPDVTYAIATTYGYYKVPMKSLKTYIMKLKTYMQKVMKTLPAGKSPEKAAIKKFAKLLGKKAVDALEKPFFKKLNDDMDNIVVYTPNLEALLGTKDDDGKTVKGSDGGAPMIIGHIHSDDWTADKGTPATFYVWSCGLIGENC